MTAARTLTTSTPCSSPSTIMPSGRATWRGLRPRAAAKGLGIAVIKVIRPRETVAGVTADELIRYALTLEDVHSAMPGRTAWRSCAKNAALLQAFAPLRRPRWPASDPSLAPFFAGRRLPWMDPSYREGITRKASFRIRRRSALLLRAAGWPWPSLRSDLPVLTADDFEIRGWSSPLVPLRSGPLADRGRRGRPVLRLTAPEQYAEPSK